MFVRTDPFRFSFLVAVFFLLAQLLTATPRNVSAQVQINATAINRFLAAQTYPQLSGTGSGGTYNISMSTPVVQISPGSAMVYITFIASAGGSTYTIPVQPTITIPNLSVSTSSIIARLQEFEGWINSRTDIPAWLRQIIISGYNDLDLTMYPSKLIDYANSLVPEFVDIEVSDIGLTFSAIEDALQFTLTSTVEGNPPVYYVEWNRIYSNNVYLRFKSNVATEVKQVRVFEDLGASWENNSLSVAIPKNGSSEELNIGVWSNIYVKIRVLYHSIYGDYMREYEASFLGSSATWHTTALINSIN